MKSSTNKYYYLIIFDRSKIKPSWPIDTTFIGCRVSCFSIRERWLRIVLDFLIGLFVWLGERGNDSHWVFTIQAADNRFTITEIIKKYILSITFNISKLNLRQGLEPNHCRGCREPLYSMRNAPFSAQILDAIVRHVWLDVPQIQRDVLGRRFVRPIGRDHRDHSGLLVIVQIVSGSASVTIRLRIAIGLFHRIGE